VSTTYPDTDIVLEDEFLLTALRNRRSVSKVSDEEPPEALIRTMLEAATWAPNHFLTEPWRFFVLRGDARVRLGAAMGDAAAMREDDPELADAARAKIAGKPLRAPYVIAVAVEPDQRDKIVELEEIAATAAAAQNMLLAAEALGLGAIWRTGWACYCPQVREFLGLSERATVLGFVYVGYTAQPAPVRVRQPVDAVARWME
jgi:nitroreductase